MVASEEKEAKSYDGSLRVLSLSIPDSPAQQRLSVKNDILSHNLIAPTPSSHPSSSAARHSDKIVRSR
ncbi:hypothetical protein EXIGLDRAFT_771540 [Exidia glandulosa HHB12029]|uniref:Uncharacterized protein n=1 Tax=Exidia glandulosa HHB12029 TaxID=1314781 RepID=A0A165FWD2_EXIGL|nr:hypothetical protein EXIGLDRAFT_771540 [Exidia glandulosa HHB12029]